MAALPSQYRGIAWLILATLVFTVINTLAKLLGDRVGLLQIVWGRYFFHFLILALLLNIRLPAVLRTRHLKLQIARSFLLLAGSALYFAAFIAMPLADAAALINLAPVIVTVLAIPFLGERVGIRRLTGALLGCAGALIIIRPGGATFDAVALLPVGAAVVYALYQLATRHVSHADSPTTSITYTAVAGAVIGSCIVPFYWQAMDGTTWLMLAMLGGVGAFGHYAMIRAYAISEASAVAPFAYAILIWMAISGYLIFGDVPDIWTVAGASVIAVSGIYIARREASLKKDVSVPKPPAPAS